MHSEYVTCCGHSPSLNGMLFRVFRDVMNAPIAHLVRNWNWSVLHCSLYRPDWLSEEGNKNLFFNHLRTFCNICDIVRTLAFCQSSRINQSAKTNQLLIDSRLCPNGWQAGSQLRQIYLQSGSLSLASLSFECGLVASVEGNTTIILSIVLT